MDRLWVWSGRAAFGTLLLSSLALLVAVYLRMSSRRYMLASLVAIALAALGCVEGVVFMCIRTGWGVTLVRDTGAYVAATALGFTVLSVVLLRYARRSRSSRTPR